MFEQLFYILLAVVGLGFLVFIHELGHYFVARREGMKIEAFSIGFGRPIYSWVRDGVRWQICWLPFGGFVKIAGMQKEGSREPYEIAGGFYSKTPWQRIKVAFAGPFVNIVFALAAFFVLWMSGGREKTFAEFTHRIGWVDPNSALFDEGVRPGDVIQTYGGRSFDGFKDLMIASVLKDKVSRIQGYKVDYLTGEQSNFDYTLRTYEDPNRPGMRLSTAGVMAPAQYLIYNDTSPMPGSPMIGSGIEKGDRVIWADGEMIFSQQQLSSVINQSTAFLTIKREGQILQTKVPRVQLNELKLTSIQRAEMDDWQHEAGIKGRVQDLSFIPYLLSPNGVVEMRLDFIDEEDQRKAFQTCVRCSHFYPLQENDVIVAIDGEPVSSSYDLLQQLQTRHALIIVQRWPEATQKILWNRSDRNFDELLNPQDLQKLVSSIGFENEPAKAGHLILLKPIAPKSMVDLPFTTEQKLMFAKEIAQTKKEIEAIQDPLTREEALKTLERDQQKVYLGAHFKDREVVYNPTPAKQFVGVFEDTWRTFSNLFTGNLSPKYMAGPVGIVQIVHTGWMLGIKEGLFWMALISLNLGIVNLLPIPILDGGHITFSLFEVLTKRRLSSKTMERLVIPFVGLLMAFFIYITYQDISRIFSRFF